MKLRGLSSESGWSYALWPLDPATGKRARRVAPVMLEDPAAIDAFFARQGRS